jgi:hypothetical protein
MKPKIILVLSLLLFGCYTFSQKANKSYFVGEVYGGGIIFFVEKNGNHGLIASLSDVATEISMLTPSYKSLPENHYKSNTKYRSNTSDGFYNTISIIKLGYYPSAASICDEYSAGSNSDWYLPSLKELEELIKSKETINQVLNNDNNPATQGLSNSYWSSSFAPSNILNIEYYQGEIKRIGAYDNYLNVRAIRKF